jgi:hypothetical protein
MTGHVDVVILNILKTYLVTGLTGFPANLTESSRGFPPFLKRMY